MRTPLLLTLVLVAGCASAPKGPLAPEAYVQSCRPADQPGRACLQPAQALAGGATRVRVDAQCVWNRTGVQMQQGAVYEITATPVLEDWKDASTRSDLEDGWKGAASVAGTFARFRARASKLPMYALVGAEGEDPKTFFKVGRKAFHTAKNTSELVLFANDWNGRYQNNHGCADVTVRRIR